MAIFEPFKFDAVVNNWHLKIIYDDLFQTILGTLKLQLTDPWGEGVTQP